MTKTSSVKLDATTIIQELEQEGTYKYLGIEEGNGIKHAAMKENMDSTQRELTEQMLTKN